MGRYLVGIDLGTTNSALAYVDLEGDERARVLEVKQRDSADTEVALPALPSFLYLPPDGGSAEAGAYARAMAPRQPGRVVTSAKSWLSHTGVDRNARFLPWGSAEVGPGEKLSPVEVSARYLEHLKRVWDERMPQPFTEQTVTITVPASFDESAQALTLEAARLAGYPGKLQLLEEPQAAFYHWLERHSLKALLELLPDLRERPQRVLVCDVGGGTTDLSLFEVLPPEARQRVARINRVAVSDHILLGGDNIDLALAHRLERKLGGDRLTPRQWAQLVALARGLKERVLGLDGSGDELFHVSIAGEGSSLFARALSGSLTRREVTEEIAEGFFPRVAADESPRRHEAGLKELGLPYAADSAVTRYLADFLRGREVDAVLFNGGTLKPRFLQDRLVEQLESWQGKAPVRLKSADLDLAVAFGAAAYGVFLRKPTGRIRGGYSHSVYLYLEREAKPPTLVCLLPQGTEAGETVKLARELPFRLLLGQPVRFQLVTSPRRPDDRGGDLVAWAPEAFHFLPPVQTVLTAPAGMPISLDGKVDVSLEASLSETGLLQLFCVHRPAAGRNERWELGFNLRQSTAPAEGPPKPSERLSVPSERLEAARKRLAQFYGDKKLATNDSPKALKQELERILGVGMDDWDLGLLRAVWDALGFGGRTRSPEHERTWFYLCGFCLRPGYGADRDPARMAELWKTFGRGPLFPGVPVNVIQWWILWRRVVGGLGADEQRQVMSRLLPKIKNRTDVMAEIIQLAGSLERAPLEEKRELGDALTRQLVKRKVTTIDQHLWALGRLTSRVPVYAGPESVLPPGLVEEWLSSILEKGFPARPNFTLLLAQACRLTGNHALDVSDDLRARVLAVMDEAGAPASQKRVVAELVAVEAGEQARAFGEALPLGLELVAELPRTA